MSNLAKAIEANTAALVALTAALQKGNSESPATPGKVAATHRSQPEPAVISVTTAEAQPEATALEYEKDVKPFAIKLAAKDKQAFLDLLAERSVKKGGDVPAAHLPEFLSRIKRVLGE